MNKSWFLCGAMASTLAASVTLAPPVMAAESGVVQTTNQFNISTKFSPSPKNNKRIGYDYLDELLEDSVVLTGPSTRVRAPRPEVLTGSRVSLGHDSPYRMEGNKIVFSGFSEAYIQGFSSFRQELEAISDAVAITDLPRDAQLAYWLNLHNVAVIETLATAYPVKRPSKLNLPAYDASLHDAKMLTVSGTPLSLRDIREKIVYTHWRDNPDVIYGFFLGDLGSPSIRNRAYRRDSVQDMLDRNADEFVNSLRGYRKGKVSKVYQDVAPFYFPNFETDLAAHLSVHASKDDVAPELAEYGVKSLSKYETVIADLVGGSGNRQRSSNVIDQDFTKKRPATDSAGVYMEELYQKFVVLKQKSIGKRGEVIIEEVPQ